MPDTAPATETPQQLLSPGCAVCLSLLRKVQPVWVVRPHLYPAGEEESFSLTLCQDCGTRTIELPYEPYASFVYVVHWPYSHQFWFEAARLEDGTLLSLWCIYRIRQVWPSLSLKEKASIRQHCKRSFADRLLDDAPSSKDPLAPYVTAWAEPQDV